MKFSCLIVYLQSCIFQFTHSATICDLGAVWKTVTWYAKLNDQPIRGVNIGGLFVLEPWITPSIVEWANPQNATEVELNRIIDQYTFSLFCNVTNSCDNLKKHWRNFYSPEDFLEIKSIGLNTVRLPVGYWYFSELSNFPSSPYILPDESILSVNHPITVVIGWARDANLQVILDLHGAPGSQNGFDNSGRAAAADVPLEMWGRDWIESVENIQGTVDTTSAMASYIAYIEREFGYNNIMALEILNEQDIRQYYLTAINAVRFQHPDLPIVVHDSFRMQEWKESLQQVADNTVLLDVHLYYAFSDQRYGSIEGDKEKLSQYSWRACTVSESLHEQSCYNLPVLIGEWSLAIDNCMHRIDQRFYDVRQCEAINERNDDWWREHLLEFSLRQMHIYEKELGWIFWTWKLDPEADKDPSAKYWSFRLARANGYIDLTKLPNTNVCYDNMNHSIVSPPIQYTTTGTIDSQLDEEEVLQGSSSGTSSAAMVDPKGWQGVPFLSRYPTYPLQSAGTSRDDVGLQEKQYVASQLNTYPKPDVNQELVVNNNNNNRSNSGGPTGEFVSKMTILGISIGIFIAFLCLWVTCREIYLRIKGRGRRYSRLFGNDDINGPHQQRQPYPLSKRIFGTAAKSDRVKSAYYFSKASPTGNDIGSSSNNSSGSVHNSDCNRSTISESPFSGSSSEESFRSTNEKNSISGQRCGNSKNIAKEQSYQNYSATDFATTTSTSAKCSDEKNKPVINIKNENMPHHSVTTKSNAISMIFRKYYYYPIPGTASLTNSKRNYPSNVRPQSTYNQSYYLQNQQDNNVNTPLTKYPSANSTLTNNDNLELA